MTKKLSSEDQRRILKHLDWIDQRNKELGYLGLVMTIIVIAYLYIQANIFMFNVTTSLFLIFFTELSLTFIADGTAIYLTFKITNDKDALVAVAVAASVAAAVATAAVLVAVTVAPTPSMSVAAAVALVAAVAAVATVAAAAVILSDNDD